MLSKTAAAVVCSLAVTFPCFAQDDLVAFYPRAEARAQNPPPEKSLRIICQRVEDQGYVTFIGAEGDTGPPVLIASYTKEKLEKPDETLRLRPTMSGNSPLVAAGDVLDWGYVFDRNADGMIDYLAFLVGALPVTPKDFQGELPKRGGRINADQMKLFNQHARLVFSHFADDDFDGRVDGLVQGVREPGQIWIERWVAARSTRRDGQLDEAWYFTTDISRREGAPGGSGKAWTVARVGAKSGLLDGQDLAGWSEYIARLNRAVKGCGLGPKDFSSGVAAASEGSQQPGARAWVNSIHKWSISYPQDWALESQDLAFVKMESPSNLPRGQVGIHSATLGTQFKSADEFADAALAVETRMSGPVQVLSRRNMVLADGAPAVEVVNLLGADAKGKSRKVFVLSKGDGFIIDAETFSDAWQELEPYFSQIISSFTLRH